MKEVNMKGDRIRTIIVWSLFIFVVSPVLAGWTDKALASDNNETNTESLAGLQAISVMVLPPDPEVERNGLKREQIQTDVEAKLRKAGIKMLTDREMKRPGFPYLSIMVNTTKENPELYRYNVKADMYRQEILNPQDEIETAFQTISIKIWSSEQTGTTSGSDLKKNVQKKLDDAIDKFITAYLTANPKK
jgi:hypothetical protein